MRLLAVRWRWRHFYYDDRTDIAEVEQGIALRAEDADLAVAVGWLEVPFRPVYPDPTALPRVDPEGAERAHRQLVVDLLCVLHI